MRIELFYDIVSPYSYLAFVALERYRPIWQMDLVLRPAFLGGVMKAVGNVPPASLPQRAPYLIKDILRLSRWFGTPPLALPPSFPGNTLTAMRLLTAVQQLHPEHLSSLTRALFELHWTEEQDVIEESAFLTAGKRAGIDDEVVRSLFAAASTQPNKDRLKQATDEAVARGAFGFPALFVDIGGNDELYFGGDRLPLLAHDLGLPWYGPVPPPSTNRRAAAG